MRRRDILILLGVVLITPLGALAQSRSGKTWRIAFFGPPIAFFENPSLGAFVQGMRELGHAEGQDFIIDDVVYDADKPDEADARHGATPCRSHSCDCTKRYRVGHAVTFRLCLSSPVILSLAGLSQACRNATGLTSLNASADAKRVELLKEAMPALRRVALLAARGAPGDPRRSCDK